MSTARPSRLLCAAWILAAALALVALAQPSAAQAPFDSVADTRPTVAVMYFTNVALERREEYEPLTRGIAEMLITTLAANPALRLVERARLQALIDEGTLNRSARIDEETAVRVGRLLGARHMIFGAFLIEPGGRMRLDARSVNVETSRVEYVGSVDGKAADLFDAVEILASRLSRELRLPPMPAGARPATAVRPRAARWYVLFSRALVEEDQHRPEAAAALFRQVLAEVPGYEPAVRGLARTAPAGARTLP